MAEIQPILPLGSHPVSGGYLLASRPLLATMHERQLLNVTNANSSLKTVIHFVGIERPHAVKFCMQKK